MFGEGILKGLAETARNFAGSFVSADRLTTVQYPEQRIAPLEATRDFPFLVYDGEDWQAGMRCVACQICEKECPPKCIYIEKSTDKKPDFVGKPQFYPAKFDIDISVCMSCQICVEVCPFEAIKMDTEFELSTTDRFGGLLFDRERLAKSNEHYHRIHPTEADEVDTRLAEEKAKADAKAKAAVDAAVARTATAKAPPGENSRPIRDGAQTMIEGMDQIFIRLQHWLVGFLPAQFQAAAGVVLGVVAIVCFFPALFALTTVFERKGLARIQNRIGPNRVGPLGILQPIADGIKSLTKEDIVPLSADAAVHFLAPVLLVVAVFMGFAVLPMGRNMVLVDMDAGLLFFFAVGASTELSVFMAGWSSRNKYSLLGAMRAVAQMISYEVPLLMSSVAVVMITGSLSLTKIVQAQNHYTWGLPHWYLFTPWGFAGFLMYAISSTAETNRSPFDLPEGESELVAGYHTEYSGFKFALFFLGEYLAMFSISGLGTTLFLGGWSAPLESLGWVPSWFWFFSKLMLSIFVFIWLRGTLPRLRQDQLMNFAWKFVLPLSLLNLLVAAAWRFLGAGWERWVICSVILILAYIGMTWLGMREERFGQRRYRYAE